jgi:hypothetical protein
VLGVVQENAPATLAVPPLKAEALNACPSVMAVAVGVAVIVDVPFWIANEMSTVVVP